MLMSAFVVFGLLAAAVRSVSPTALKHVIFSRGRGHSSSNGVENKNPKNSRLLTHLTHITELVVMLMNDPSMSLA